MAAKRLIWYLGIAFCIMFVLLWCQPSNVSLRVTETAKHLLYIIQDLVHTILISVNWLYWGLLFVPFFALYICIGEKLYMMGNHVKILQKDVNGKTRFIEWQSVALTQLDSRLLDLRKEIDVLRKSNDIFKQEEESWRKSREVLKKKIREQQKILNTERPLVRQEVVNTVRQEILTVVKKNKSESNIKPKEMVDNEIELQQSNRPKTQPNRSIPSIVMESKQKTNPEWERARLRLVERSRRLMKDRINNSLKIEEEDEKSKATCFASASNSVPRLNGHLIPSRQNSNFKCSVPKTNSEMSVQSEVDLENLHHSRSSDPINKAFTAPDVPGYGIGEFRESKVKSYTEVYKRKVHVPSGGSGPRITIEGQRRWCF